MPKFKKGDAVTFNRKKVLESDRFYEFNVLSKNAMLDYLTDGKTYIIPNDLGTNDGRISITLDKGTTVFCYQDFFDAVKDKQEYDMQNQEKQNLKPFNLERALAGDPVVTRDGRKVRQITQFDNVKYQLEYPLVGVIEDMNTTQTWTNNGVFLKGHMYNAMDLFMAPIEKSGWIKIFPQQAASIKATTSCIYDNEADALKFMFPDAPTGIVVQIKWTE